MKKINISEIVNLYESVSQVKRMQETIKAVYGVDNKTFVEAILKPCKEMINNAISANYNGAIEAVTDGERALLDAIKRAKSDRKFAKEAQNFGVSLQDAADLIRLYYPAVSQDGKALQKVNEYKTDEKGDYILNEDGKRIISACWYDYKVITASNAANIVVSCLRRMRYEAIHEISHVDGWNIKKVGK